MKIPTKPHSFVLIRGAFVCKHCRLQTVQPEAYAHEDCSYRKLRKKDLLGNI